MAITSVVTNSLAKICQYLVANNNAIREGMFNGSINEKYSTILYMERKALEYGIQQNLSGVQGASNYVYSLLGGEINKANNILTNGGGGINVSAVANSSGALQPYNINITITAGQSGVSTISNPSWFGLTYISDVIINGSSYQNGVGFTFNQSAGAFDFSLSGYILQENDKFSALAFIPISSSKSGSANPQTIYVSASAGVSVNIPNTIGKVVSLGFRGIGLVQVITIGTPTTNQVLFDSVTGSFIVASDNPFFQDELFAVQFY